MKKVFSILTLVFLFCFVFAGKTSAKVLVQEKGLVSVAKEEIVNDDLFIGAETATIEGTVNGDVFIGAGSVKELGVINGNLHIGSGNVTVTGQVSGNLYLAGGSVSLQGAKVGGSVISTTGMLTIDAESSIGGSLIVGCGTLNNQAPIGRNAFIGAGTIVLNNQIGGEARLGGGKIDIGPKTSIGQGLTYLIDDAQNFTLASEASVGGEIKKIDQKTLPDHKLKENVSRAAGSAKIGVTIFSFLGALIVGFILIKLFPKPIMGISDQVKNSFFPNLGIGFLILISALPALVLLMVTGIGLPLAGVTLTFLVLNLYLTKLAIGVGVGVLISGKFGWEKTSLFVKFALGLAVVYLAMKLPILGWIFSLLVTFSGLGALLLYYKNSLKAK